MPTVTSPRILLVDSYDSFTYNLASLCRQSIPDCELHIIKNDSLTISELVPHLPSFAAIIIGPGPGAPDNVKDIGVVKHLWKLPLQQTIPIFGVCLGLQSLAIENGAELKRLSVVKHGQISKVHHQGVDLFEGVGNIDAVRYHSLHVNLLGSGLIEELAWADDGAENGRVVMAVKHKTRPFYAVQYHPESVRTVGGGRDVVRNFWRLAKVWNADRMIKRWNPQQDGLFSRWPLHAIPKTPHSKPTVSTRVKSSVINLPQFSVTDICKLLGVEDEQNPFVLLDSAAKPGRFSIIGALMPSSPHITYTIHDTFVRVKEDNHTRIVPLGDEDIWSWVASFMRPWKALNGRPDVPFWGGLIGYLSYELGADSLVRLKRRTKGKRHPDLNLVFVQRSIVIDTAACNVHVQSLLPNDDRWITETVASLKTCPVDVESVSVSPETTVTPTFTLPDQKHYKSRINMAKEQLFAGESYELCLTAPTRINFPKPPRTGNESTSWTRYKRLRQSNPAPHSAYLRLHPTTFLSSSPERFLSFTRPSNSVFQLRPIKGTVRKSPGITRAVAEELLIGSPKEVAENLMIVDLIRHDLHGVLGEDVTVKQFCAVEEYETVWQLVSVIEGKLPRSVPEPENIGWDVLKRSLPPGSMTGAPKKRSVEILQTLEDTERGIYSGVFGYWCVSGGGDWSVTIRSCFKYDDGTEVEQNDQTPQEEWLIGAGGAITALSCPEAEWDEMTVKLQSVLRTFSA